MKIKNIYLVFFILSSFLSTSRSSDTDDASSDQQIEVSKESSSKEVKKPTFKKHFEIDADVNLLGQHQKIVAKQNLETNEGICNIF